MRGSLESKTHMSATTSVSHSSRLKVPLSEQAYYMLRDRILGGAFPPGTVLSRRKLAEEFEMSFLPISEALQRLENEGLVESRPRVGTRVRTPTPEEVRGRYIVREALEAKSAELCCERAIFQERLELRRMAEHLDTLYARSAAGERDTDLLYVVHQHHMNLHMRIAEYARCPELKEAIEKNQVLIHNWFFDVTAERRVLPDRFHQILIEAVTGDNPMAADQAMRQHIRYGLEGILQAVERYSAADDWRLKRQNKQPYPSERTGSEVEHQA
jgi:GntR family transcriptional regulator, rspAB operon transcriptional repressor